MNLRKLAFIVLAFATSTGVAQLKIGENPNRIDAASIIELESTNKAFVLTRLTTSQMNGIRPLNGALVYNTDTGCIHYYNGSWANLCEGSAPGSFSFNDNGNGTFTILYSDGTSFTSSDLTGPQGTQGEKGDQGDQGIQGIQGEKGDKGDQGDQGIQGLKGDQGDQGIQGLKGDKGDQGDQGIQGLKGDKGDQGDQGIQGVKGDKGDQGDQGIQGLKGD
ncbi:MAG: hypothetical protein AAF361_14045, partial [Bacteroidota bacterium]